MGKKIEKVFITNRFEETQKIGEKIVQKILQQGTWKHAVILALHGELGGGKTTFTQGLAQSLGIKRRIISPTFIIMRTYKIRFNPDKVGVKIQDSGFKNFYHIDLYRIKTANDIEGLGIDEILKNPENIVVIEWAERMGDLLPDYRVDVYFEYIDEEKRKITIKN